MSHPRRVLPHQVHLVTMRCSERRHFLRPTAAVTAIFRYALFLAASRYGVNVIAVLAESNHWHAVVGDPEQTLSKFMHDVNQLVARALNAYYGRGGALWTPRFSNVELHDPETILEKITYVITGPVKDGLVRTPEEWGGLLTTPEQLGGALTEERPGEAFFGGRRPDDWIPTYEPARVKFLKAQRRERTRLRRTGARAPVQPAPERSRKRKRKGSSLPESASLKLVVPPGFEDLSLSQFRALVREHVDVRLGEIHAERRKQGLTRFLGMRRVLDQDPLKATGDTFPTFERNPRLACCDSTRRVRLLAELVHWREEYSVARKAWARGNRQVVFPHGTYYMRVQHKALVAGPPLPAAS